MLRNGSKTFYLVTGFHRSGTSLLAQTLSANGMNMGEELMGATFSNPLGHVEDLPVVRLHDKIYKLNGADWRYHDTSPLIKPIWLPNYISSYLQGRVNSNVGTDRRGVKDPRAVHFLKDWKVAGGEDIRFIFIYREWKTAAYSLLKRHSRHLINSALPIEKHVTNLSFWQQESLAYDMWLSANTRICDFYEANKQECILLSQESLVAGKLPSVIDCVRMNIEPSMFGLTTYNKDILSKYAPIEGEQMLCRQKIDELEACYQRLHKLSDLPKVSYQQAVAKTYGGNISKPSVFVNASFNFDELEWPELRGALLRVPQSRYSYVHYKNVMQREPNTAERYFDLAKVAHLQGQWLVMRVLKIRASIVDTILRCSTGLTPLDLTRWRMFFESDVNWLKKTADKLAKENPFSLRLRTELPARFNTPELSSSYMLDLSFDQVVSRASEYNKDELSSYFSFILLTQSLSYDEYVCIANEAVKHELFDVCEFVGFHLLRLARRSESQELMNTALEILQSVYQYLGNTKFLALVSDFMEKDVVPVLNRTLVENSQAVREDRSTSSRAINKTIRHRFAVLPHALDYKKILSIGYEDAKAGKLFDKLNSRLCFLAKDNTEWLSGGLSVIEAVSAKRCLENAVRSHWGNLWPKQVNEFMWGEKNNESFLLSELDTLFVPKAIDTSTDQAAIHIYVYDFEPSSFSAFWALLLEKEQECKITIFVTEAEKSKHATKLKRFESSGIKSSLIQNKNFPSLIEAILKLNRGNENTGVEIWTMLVHCRANNTNLSRQNLVLSWYTLLGGEHSFSSLYSNKEQKSVTPKLALPSYAPWVLKDIQDKPFYYPLDHMFCVNDKGFELLLQRTEVMPHRWLVKVINEFKRFEDSISFVHQRFLAQLE